MCDIWYKMEGSKETTGQVTLQKKSYFKEFCQQIQTHRYLIGIFILWLILCLPQNIFTLFLYFNPEPQGFEPEFSGNYSQNYSCFEDYESFKDKLEFGVRGVFVTVVGSCGMISNIFSITVLRRLAAKSGFNRLLLSLGTYIPYPRY